MLSWEVDEDPGSVRIGLEGLDDVSGKVGFGARGSNAGSHNLSSGHVQVGDETLRTVSVIFKFLSLDVTRLHRQRGVQTFESLDAGHLIRARYMRPRCSERWSGLIHLTHRADLRGQFGGVVGRGSEPIPLQMRLQSARLLKNAPRCVEKSAPQCRV